MKIADYACRALLQLFPRDIREAHGAEMRDTFLAAASDRAWIPEAVDMAVSAMKARVGYPRIPGGQRPMASNHRGNWNSGIGSDLRHALRALLARRRTTALAVSLLALAIAACTSVFTVADAVIFNQVPYRDGDRLVCAGVQQPGWSFPSAYSEPAVIRAWRDAGIFEGVEAHESTGLTLDSIAEPSTEPAVFVTPGLIDLFGVPPLRGRLFRRDDAREAVTPVLISEGLWRSHFGADDAIAGRSTSIDGKQTRIVGVMPGDFRFPHGAHTIWKVFELDALPAGSRNNLTPVVKLPTGMPREEAGRLAAAVVRGINPTLMKDGATIGFNLPSGGRAFDDYTVNTVRILFTGVILVLLVACVNVANLLLAQALGRRRERAVRMALGASRLRLVRQALLESAVIASLAAGAGLLVSWAFVAGFDTLLPSFISEGTINRIDFDRRAAGLVIALTVVVTLAAGVLPAWLGGRGGAALRDGDRSTSEGRVGGRIASGLVVAEVAVCVALLAGATLLMRSFVVLANAPTGMNTEGVMRVQASLPAYQEPDPVKRKVLSNQLLDRLAALPEVEVVTRTYGLPPSAGMTHFMTITTDSGAEVRNVALKGFRVTSEFFVLLRMELVAGRYLQNDDAESTAVIGESLASRLWPGEPPPIGRSFRLGSLPPKRVVGITRDIRTPLMDPRSDTPEYFEPYAGSGTTFILRFREGQSLSPQRMKAVVREVHPQFMTASLETIDESFAEILERPRAAVAAATAFSVFGTIVCAAGLFSVLSLSVARRRREFGIRLAIGAHPKQLSRLVMRQTAVTLAGGIVLGIAGAFALARNLSAVLVGVDTSDVSSWIIVVALIATAGVAAAWLPVRDARRTDPLLLLREE